MISVVFWFGTSEIFLFMMVLERKEKKSCKTTLDYQFYKIQRLDSPWNQLRMLHDNFLKRFRDKNLISATLESLFSQHHTLLYSDSPTSFHQNCMLNMIISKFFFTHDPALKPRNMCIWYILALQITMEPRN